MNQVLKNVRNQQQSGNNNGNGNGNQVVPFPQMLEKFKGEIARALPKHINPDRMTRIALTAFRMTPKLGECEPASIFAAVIQSSQLGLEVGLMGEAHLVPYGNKCQLIPGYQGLMKLARNSGLVQDIYAHEVRANDTFDVVFGLDRSLVHQPLKKFGFPASDEERGEIVGFYAVGKFKDGTSTFVAMSRFEVEKLRDNSKGYQAAKRYKKESLWDTDFLSMGLKTAIRRLCKFLPKSPELAAALALDAAAENGKEQGMKLDDVIDGTFTPVSTFDDDDGNNQSDAGSAQGDNQLNAELAAVLAAFDKANSLDALDEAYVQAEGNLNSNDLEAAMKAYRVRKGQLANAKQGSLV